MDLTYFIFYPNKWYFIWAFSIYGIYLGLKIIFQQWKIRSIHYTKSVIFFNSCDFQLQSYTQPERNRIDDDTSVFFCLEFKDFFSRSTQNMFALCTFGVECDSFNDVLMLNRITLYPVILFFPEIVTYLPVLFMNISSNNVIGLMIEDAKKQHKKCTELKRNNFLQLMLDAADDELDLEDSNKEGRDRIFELRKSMSEECIIAQSVLFLFAGFKMSNTITLVRYTLTNNVAVQGKLRSKILLVLDRKNGGKSYYALHDTMYLKSVLLELQKCPVVAHIDCRCTHMYTIPGTDLVLNIGDTMSAQMMGLHYDPKFYTNPKVFDPEQFSAERENEQSQYVFLPFGAGPWNCIDQFQNEICTEVEGRIITFPS